ncbi:MAG: tetratricopeptide repeat protein [Magnetospirillum sp.]|nr:tetratricopeptide repeat protein [Magnetospirillum sp.]
MSDAAGREASEIVALAAAGKSAEAVARARAFAQDAATDPSALQFCSRFLALAGLADEALALARAAIRIEPTPSAYGRRLEGEAAALLGDAQAAIAAFGAAAELDPTDPGLRLRWADLLIRFERYIEADSGLARAPATPGIQRRRAVCALAFGRVAEAERFARAALDDPDEGPLARQWLASVMIQTGRVAEARAELAAVKRALPSRENAWTDDLFAANYDPALDAPALKALYAEWALRFCPRETPLAAPAIGGRRLRVAYVSPDFRRHSLRNFIAPVLAAHDRAKVEVYAYALVPSPDAVTAELQGLVDVWRDVARDDDEAFVARARADGIDVAVDLAGHTAGARLKAFARRLAPAQVTWLGYGGTTGVPAMDWYLADDRMVPIGAEDALSERVWRLDRAPFAFAPPAEMPAVTPPPSRDRGHTTFGSFSRLVRINDDVVAAWARILLGVPGSRLTLNALPFVDALVRGRMEGRFERFGVGRERLDLVYTSPQPATWAAYGGIDVALDPFPHNGGVTTFEALWMGVPVVSLRARAPLGRFGACLLDALDMSAWCSDDVDGYVACAIAAAREPAHTAATRAGLRARMAGSVLCDGVGLARALEKAYAGMREAAFSAGTSSDSV